MSSPLPADSHWMLLLLCLKNTDKDKGLRDNAREREEAGLGSFNGLLQLNSNIIHKKRFIASLKVHCARSVYAYFSCL